MANMMNMPILGLVENMSYFVCPDCGKSIIFSVKAILMKLPKRCNTKVLYESFLLTATLPSVSAMAKV